MTRKGLECYRQAIEANPEDVPSHRFPGHALCRLGLLDESIAAIERALEIGPGYVLAAEQLKELRGAKQAGPRLV
ncbi:MAG TPA: hypothetical protein VNO81_08400 [Candidatus Nitrosotenuis sp.]|nr:hypothetical protein [Candidatus Nitrosotenuis sp.]